MANRIPVGLRLRGHCLLKWHAWASGKEGKSEKLFLCRQTLRAGQKLRMLRVGSGHHPRLVKTLARPSYPA